MYKKLTYLFITILFIIISLIIIIKTNIYNDTNLSKAIQVILILYLIRLSIGLTLYIKKQFNKQKYFYNIIMNVGLLIL